MPVRTNALYNDPALGQGFSNLAAIFAPPGGSDLAGYATAAAKKAEAARVAEMFAYAKDPNYRKDLADRMAFASGVYTPTQGYYNVDSVANTSRANNAADNARALEVARMDQAGQTARTLLAPVAENATRFAPPSVVEMFKVPPVQVGNVSAGQGETVHTADGRTFVGAPKPLSESEDKAAEAARLRAAGKITDDDMKAIIFGNTPVEAVVGEGGKPVNVSRVDAIGKTPYDKPTAGDKPNLANYKTPDGRSGSAKFDPVKGWIDSQSGEVLPAGTQTYSANLTGDRNSTGLGPTTANATAGNNRAAEVTRTLNTLDLYEGLVKNNPGVVGFPGLVRGTAQNAVAVAKDIAKSFGKDAPQVEEAAAAVRDGLKSVAPEFFDPAIAEADFYQGTLAYALARTENPSGEVSRQAFERAYQRVRGGILANPDQILATIGAFRKSLQTELQAVDTLRDPTKARTDVGYKPPAGAKVEEWVRDPATGKLMRKAQ